MAISFGAFIQLLLTSPAIAVTVILTLGVVLVNGWTDAPNAIATCVSTRSMTPRNAILMAAVFHRHGLGNGNWWRENHQDGRDQYGEAGDLSRIQR